MKPKLFEFRFLFILIILSNAFGFILIAQNSNIEESNKIHIFQKRSIDLKSSASKNLTLNKELSMQTIDVGNPKDFNISLNNGLYYIWIEPYGVDIKFEIAFDDQFSNIIKSIDEYETGGEERCSFNLNQSYTIFIEVSCPSGSGFFDIIVFNNINIRYKFLELDDEKESVGIVNYFIDRYYTTAPEGNISISVETDNIGLDLVLYVSYDVFFKDIEETEDSTTGTSGKEEVELELEKERNIYVEVYAKEGYGEYNIIISEIEEPVDSNLEEIVIIIIIIISIVAVGSIVGGFAYFKVYKGKRKVKIPDQKVQLEKKIREPIEVFDRMLRVSNRIKFDMMRNVLNMDEDTFKRSLFEWADKFSFKIESDEIIVNANTIDEFINELDKQFETWKKVEKEKNKKI